MFYIGKGKGHRSQGHIVATLGGYHCNPKLSNKIKKIAKKGLKYGVEFLFSSDIEQECFEKEIYWISFYGRETLTNLTNGGEGGSGHQVTNEARKHLSSVRKEKYLSGQYKNVKLVCVDGIMDSVHATCQRIGMSDASFRQWSRNGLSAQSIADRYRSFPNGRPPLSEQHKSRLKEANKGNPGNKGRKFSLNHRDKIAASNQGRSSGNTSGFVGVYKKGNKWQAQIGSRGRRKFLGTYLNVFDAAYAYNVASLECFGPHAYQNALGSTAITFSTSAGIPAVAVGCL